MKYEFTGKTKTVDGFVLNQIRALVNIRKRGVRVGDLGGWIENESNLSHKGTCWVYSDAIVRGFALVERDTWAGTDKR